MMKKIAYLMVIVVLSVFVASCAAKKDSPADAAKNIASLFQKKNYTAIVDCIAFDENETPENIAAQKNLYENIFSEKAGESFDEKGGIKSYEVLEETISDDGTKASVKMQYNYGDGSSEEISNDFVRVNDKWMMEINK
jgi:hypothetical protein